VATLLRPPLVFDRRQKRPIGTPDSYPNLIESTLRASVLALVQPAFSVRLSDSAPPRIKQTRHWETPNLLTSTLFATTERIRQGLEQWDDSAPPRKWQLQVDCIPNLLGTTLSGAAPPSLDLPLRAEMWDDAATRRKRDVEAQQFMGRAVWLDAVPRVLSLDASAFQAKYQVIAQQLDARPVWRDPLPRVAMLDQSAFQAKYAVYVDPPLLLTLRLSLIAVPDVVGEAQAQAELDIAAAGFVAQVSSAFSPTVAAGLVISQAPLAGALASAGSIVAIVVSLGVEPVVETAQQTPAGKRRPHRYFLEIDGQQFLVDSAAEATQLLQRARAIAEHQAEQKAQVAEKRLKSKPKVPAVRVDAPSITVSPDLLADVKPLIEDIKRLYLRAGELAELRLLLARQLADEDDDEDVLLLI
jgi:hypothetical protein